MSWFRVFSAVLAANLVAFSICYILSTVLLAASLGISVTALQNQLFGGHFTVGASAASHSSNQAVSPIDEQVDRFFRNEQERSRRMQLKMQKQQNADRINQQTCNFWRQQVIDNPTSKNIAYRDSACSR